MNYKKYILTSLLLATITPVFSGPGDELKLPKKDKKEQKEENKGVKGFVSLLPKDGTSADGNSMRNRGLAMNINNRDVEAHIKDYTKQYLAKRDKWYNTVKTTPRYQNIFSLYDRILSSYGIPKELKYLSLIESDLKATAVSVAGATGPWQIMYDEAKSYNLIRGGRDLRTDYEASTHVAAKLIRTLYNRYNDWLLVLSAYNAGMGRVDKAIKQAGTKDFWKVQHYLPNETRHHVRRFIATHYYFEQIGDNITTTAKNSEKIKNIEQSNRGLLQPGMGILRIKGIYHAGTVANYLDIDEKTFNYNNPDFNIVLGSGAEYDMRIPSEKIQLFLANKETILQKGINELLK